MLELADAVLQLLTKLNETAGVAFVAATPEGNLLLTPKADAIDPLVAGLSPRQQQLDVTQLHKVVIEKLLGMDEADSSQGREDSLLP